MHASWKVRTQFFYAPTIFFQRPTFARTEKDYDPGHEKNCEFGQWHLVEGRKQGYYRPRNFHEQGTQFFHNKNSIYFLITNQLQIAPGQHTMPVLVVSQLQV